MKLRNIILSAVCMAPPTGFAYAQSSAVGEQVPLVELYTSQSCGLCPKANRQFSEFAQTHDVIALTFPVGYWDYLGWKDTFAQPEFGARQKAYNETMGRRGPYTPQVIFHGADHCSATREKSMTRKADKARKHAAPLSIDVRYDGATVTLSEPLKHKVDIWVVEYLPGETRTTPEGGANRRKELVYFNRVVGIAHEPASGGDQRVGAPCPSACVVIVQETEHGDVLGADIYAPSAMN